MRNLLNAIKALSDETRLRMIYLLLDKECCVCEIMQAMDISQTRASRNLNILYDAGFLNLRKEGLWSHYSMKRDELDEYLIKLVESVEIALQTEKKVLSDKRKLSDIICENKKGVKI